MSMRRLRRLRPLLIVVCLSLLAVCLYGYTSGPSYTNMSSLPVVHQQRLFVERPLIVLTLSYHAAPIYDLMDQLQPLGVEFIERGIDAYACRYFNTCRHHDPLKVSRLYSYYIYFLVHLCIFCYSNIVFLVSLSAHSKSYLIN